MSYYYDGLRDAYHLIQKRERAKISPNAPKERLAEVYNNQNLQRVVSKREPGEPVKTQRLKLAPSAQKQYDRDREVWRQETRKKSAQYRLKTKDKVPTKDGKKMFEEFMRNVREQTDTRGSYQDSEFMNQVYLSARALEFDKWILFITEML
jgi:hypothetical protein